MPGGENTGQEGIDMELRKYTCSECGYEFFVDCDADNYPNWYPYCDNAIQISDGSTETVTIPE
jgi:predicted Zn-ribbon and HTH transcriptional regulator